MENHRTLYGIIGDPLTHSLSPVMHNAAFEALGVDAEYKLFSLKEDEIAPFFEDLRDPSNPIFGLNVTVPYKEMVLPYLDTLTPLVKRIGAVNTIVITEERKLIGYNTDAPGFMAHLEELNFNVKDKRIALLGAGGSARAILATLCLLPDRPHSIKIYNRTLNRVAALLQDLGQRVDMSLVEVVSSLDDLDLELADFLINTTSLGLKPEDPCMVHENLLHGNMLVYDLIYNPKETALLRLAKEKGATVANGLGMLYYQGVLAFQHWANIQLPEEVKNIMRERLEQALGNA